MAKETKTNEIKFLFNGIKIEGKLVKGYYSKGKFLNGAVACFYAHGWFKGQSELLRKYFNVTNDSDSMTDYFEEDHIYFYENDKYLDEFEKMVKLNEIRNAKSALKRYEKIKETQPLRFERYYKEDYERVLKVLAA